MPISSDHFEPLDDAINRLATESILAQAGRDDGLVPSFSLLGDLRELCAGNPLLSGPVTATRAGLERLLDTAQPFDVATLGELRMLVEWLPVALSRLKRGDPVPPLGAAVALFSVAAEDPAFDPAASDGDVMLVLNLSDNRELLAEFYAETVDHLQQIEAALLALDQRPDNPEALASMFRSFHTIKGNAGFLGFIPMHTLAHEVESLLDLARNDKLRLTAPIITEILRSRDALQALTHQIGVALEKGQLPDQIVPVSHLMSAVKRLAELSHNLAGKRAGAMTGNPVVHVTAVGSPRTTAEKIHLVEADPMEEQEIGCVLPTSNAVPAAVASPPVQAVLSVTSNAVAKKSAASVSVAKSGGASVTVRVNIAKLDSLMDVVGELVIVQSQLLESSQGTRTDNSTHQRNVAQLGRITKDLQSTAMALRMIPIKPTFQKMERLARDLARDFGKKVAFITDGEGTELDRTVVEEIGDPLVHMVRNALDHGLESTADRVAAGKPEIGELRLRAYHQGSNIVIELQDDGRGIDPEKIYRKAVEKGIIAAGAQLTRDEILALILAPGFSTAEKITAISGRGVGMDVVKRNIEKLRGHIEISSEVHRGSIFKIKLPLTMAIIDGLVVRVGEDRFILPTTAVQMALRPARDAISTVYGRGEVLSHRGRFVPIHRLHRRFGIAHEATNPWDGIVIIIETSGKTSALLVDEMLSKQEVVIKNLGAFMQNLPGVAGAAILGDGNIALILDPGSLLNAA